MAEVVLFHHAQGLTDGVRAFADELRAAGHTVHVPDLYEGRTFATLDEGVNHGDNEVGMDAIIGRAAAAVEDLPSEVVYAGFSLGAVPAQALTQRRPGAKGALLYHAGVPTDAFGVPWPDGVPLQIHTTEGDEWVELDVVQELAAVDGGELFLYPGDGHLFADSSLPGYEPSAAALLLQRTLAFLA